MTDACPAIEPGGALVAPLLNQIDCQVAYYVEATYAALFGPFGFLQPVLTGALTLYVAFYGFQLMTGRGNLSLSGLAPKVFLIGVVLALATRWAAYQTFFFDLLYGGADQLASIMVGSGGFTDGPGAIARLDLLLQEITGLASSWNDGSINRPDAVPASPSAAGLDPVQAEQASRLPFSNGAVNLLWFSAILLALSTVGMLIITKVLLGLLLAIGPVMLVTALFAGARGLFEGWVKTLALYALAPVFTMALAGGVLQVLEPMVQNIREMRAIGEANPQSVFVLAVTVFIFALLIGQLFRMCAHLTGNWRLFSSADGARAENAGSAKSPSSNDIPGNRSGRVVDMVVAVERSSTGAATDSRRRGIASSAVIVPRSENVASTLLSRRTNQRFRSFGERPGLKGRLA